MGEDELTRLPGADALVNNGAILGKFNIRLADDVLVFLPG
jgi:hypothetical protein